MSKRATSKHRYLAGIWRDKIVWVIGMGASTWRITFQTFLFLKHPTVYLSRTVHVVASPELFLGAHIRGIGQMVPPKPIIAHIDRQRFYRTRTRTERALKLPKIYKLIHIPIGYIRENTFFRMNLFS